jgi:hypothetical protein
MARYRFCSFYLAHESARFSPEVGHPNCKVKIRKQVYELTLDDLSKFPVWEFALDEEGEKGQDEATVRPYDISGAVDPTEGMFVVRAAFVLADGTQMHGYLTPPVQANSGLGTLHPVIITNRGQVMFWHGVVTPDAQRLAQNYEKLGRDAVRVFPVQVTTNIELVGGPIHTEIPGFMVLEDFRTGNTKTVM